MRGVFRFPGTRDAKTPPPQDPRTGTRDQQRVHAQQGKREGGNEMRFEFTKDGATVGAAQWEGPGQVTLHVADPAERRQLAEYFAAETTYLSTRVRPGRGVPDPPARLDAVGVRTRLPGPGPRMGYEVERTAAEQVERRPARHRRPIERPRRRPSAWRPPRSPPRPDPRQADTPSSTRRRRAPDDLPVAAHRRAGADPFARARGHRGRLRHPRRRDPARRTTR